MAEHVIYVDRFRLREGALQKFELYANDMADFVKNNEPEVLSFEYFVDANGETGTAVFVFVDADALDLHLDLASSKFQETAGLVEAAEIELLGRPSDRAAELTRSFGGTTRTKLAGFSRQRGEEESGAHETLASPRT
jgi:quinol monooxygenase YgiN